MGQPDDLTAETTYEGDTAIVRIAGEIDLATRDVVTAAAQTAVEGGALRLVLDMSGVTFIDSSGLAALIGARSLAPLSLSHLSDSVGRLLETTGLTDTFHIER